MYVVINFTCLVCSSISPLLTSSRLCSWCLLSPVHLILKIMVANPDRPKINTARRKFYGLNCFILHGNSPERRKKHRSFLIQRWIIQHPIVSEPQTRSAATATACFTLWRLFAGKIAIWGVDFSTPCTLADRWRFKCEMVGAEISQPMRNRRRTHDLHSWLRH